MNTKHTPGPWKLVAGLSLRTNVVGGDGVEYTKMTVATIEPEDDNLEAVQVAKANARLIAAAPDLLAALRAVAEFWAGGDAPEELTAQINAALAKAGAQESRKSGLGRYHGSAFDRGGADSWYGRAREPHFWFEGTYHGTMVSEAEMTPEEIAEYHRGYDDYEKLYGKKEY